MKYIDAHVHVWTPDTAHYPLSKGFEKSDMKPASFTPEELFKHTRPAGVDRINTYWAEGREHRRRCPTRR
jgi:predicted TIM-barrel fold metal-dependent hydrolase